MAGLGLVAGGYSPAFAASGLAGGPRVGRVRRDPQLSLVDDDFSPPTSGARSVPLLGFEVPRVRVSSGFGPLDCICRGLRRHRPFCRCECHVEVLAVAA